MLVLCAHLVAVRMAVTVRVRCEWCALSHGQWLGVPLGVAAVAPGPFSFLFAFSAVLPVAASFFRLAQREGGRTWRALLSRLSLWHDCAIWRFLIV